ncbi:glycosyltransferase [Gordonia sp. PKS22-38]|uniref:Glycosyltransferase n=1 Tax=Gordonia prachuapensis TaxID=3115651 RepID=A0ABU7MYG3_9ACTN|nr:glycosyltransferase [Gordonia sp. PKS22-38]
MITLMFVESMDSTVAVIVCSFGMKTLTDSVVKQLHAESTGVAIVIVDNGDDFPENASYPSSVHVLRPGVNLGWAAGSNLGIEFCLTRLGVDSVVLLNNDVELSQRFLTGLQAAARSSGAWIVAPCYDHNWPHQRFDFCGSPSDFKAKDLEHEVPFVDGTCLWASSKALRLAGPLDTDHWPQWNWGCDKDLCMRVRNLGGKVVVTERAYLSHYARATASGIAGFSEQEAELENDLGMAKKWGPDWEESLYSGFPELSRRGIVQLKLRDSESVRGE